MADLLSLGADIDWPDHETATVVREHFARATGYGRLAELAEWVASVRPSCEPFGRVRLLVCGPLAHHGAAEAAGVGLVAVDTADCDVPTAFAAGVALVDAEVDSGADLLLLAMPELRADIMIAASVLTNTEPVKVLTRGASATAPETWMNLAVEVRDVRRSCMAARDQPDVLLDEIGSARLAAAAAICMRAAVRRTPIVVDGPSAAVGALVAYEAAPRAVRWWGAADVGADPVHELALTRLGQKPVLGLGSSLGDGLAALLCVPVLQSAAALAREASA